MSSYLRQLILKDEDDPDIEIPGFLSDCESDDESDDYADSNDDLLGLPVVLTAPNVERSNTVKIGLHDSVSGDERPYVIINQVDHWRPESDAARPFGSFPPEVVGGICGS
ncbi:hypothetical protein HDU87_002386 [Geranomyces variabilis]|uniref:Uncharacterized protein n=1 Tax=Geranomyces variabilis TaxID=109894 RepID=A0AAD5TL71_9FUNG|nr:hypothetical protein HDU87_002386 [Geranomyces variabilis]